MKRLLNIIGVLLLMPLLAFGQQTTKKTNNEAINDSVVVSLLTCTPGELVYELYGHTALRVREIGARQSDWVFNYGTFTFHQPHFMWRFMLGQTDYELGVVPYTLFYDAYVREGRGIDEQVLNLTPNEARRLMDALAKNLEPENATYRYNFFYDNCVTRALRKVEECVDGKVIWPQVDEHKTLRNIVDEFSACSPWNKLGQDLLLGAEADNPANVTLQSFAPIYAERFAEKAMIVDNNGRQRHLVSHVVTLLPAQIGVDMYEKAFPLSPTMAFALLLVFPIILGAVEWFKKKNYWQYDVLLLVAQGLTGCIISFLFFFSAHPAVGSNWLITMFNPLPLVLFPWYMKAASQHKRSWVAGVEIVLLILALLVGVTGLQQYPHEVYFMITILMIRMFTHFYLLRGSQKAVIK